MYTPYDPTGGNRATSDRQALCQCHLAIQTHILDPIFFWGGGGFLQADSLENRVCVERVRAVNGLFFSLTLIEGKRRKKMKTLMNKVL